MIWDWGSTSSGPPFHGWFYSGLIVSYRVLGYADSGTLRMSCALPYTWWCCTLEPVWAPPWKLRMKSLSYVCSGLFCKPNPLFCFICGIRVASKSSVDSIPFKRCSHISMGVLILLIIEFVMLILFQPVRFSSRWPYHFFPSARSNLSFFSTVFVSSVPSCLCFPALPPFSFKESDVLTKYPFYSCEVPSFFSINVLTRWFSWRCSSSLSFFIIFLLRWI